MATGSVKIEIPFDALVTAVSGLSVEEKQRLMDVLDEQLAELEDEDPAVRAAMAEALADYEAGDYVTLDDYLAEHSKPS